jgi:hypothetical protein
MEIEEKLQSSTPNDLSPKCQLTILEARWAAAYDRDPYSDYTVILGNLVLKARTGSLDESRDEDIPFYGRALIPRVSMAPKIGIGRVVVNVGKILLT